MTTRTVWQVRLSAEEDAEFRRRAAESGTDRAGLFRRLVFGEADVPVAAGPSRQRAVAVAVSGEAAVNDERIPPPPRRVPKPEPVAPSLMALAAMMGTRDITEARKALGDGSWKRYVKGAK